ncbi:Protein of unknown function [Cotesia congregata]|uniref:Uncharacterized protein n=1 Tax=Cotesia congregata TaxID=51543 RepID=A0A8J2H899_COTCN|nr:Protein of unknown function [Cotesia congregata]
MAHLHLGSNYLAICVDANLLTLEERRLCTSILLILILILLHGAIDCPKLLALIPISVPARNTRSALSFYTPPATNNLVRSAPITRL